MTATISIDDRKGFDMSKWGHDDLAEDLRGYLSENKAARLIWCDMQLGPAGSPRPDIYALPKSYSKFFPFAYEVKVSRPDFQSDINSGKWQKYYAYASAVVFAAPDGLIKKTEVPDGAGLIVRKEKIWRMIKAPKVNRIENLPLDTWIKLVMDGVHRIKKENRINEYLVRESAFKRALGDEIAAMVASRDNMKYQIQMHIDAHRREIELLRDRQSRERSREAEKNQFAEGEFARLCDMLGLPKGSPAHRVGQEINSLIQKTEECERVKGLVSAIENAQRCLSDAKVMAIGEPK